MYILNNCLCCNSPRSEERKFSVDFFFQALRKITKSGLSYFFIDGTRFLSCGYIALKCKTYLENLQNYKQWICLVVRNGSAVQLACVQINFGPYITRDEQIKL